LPKSGRSYGRTRVAADALDRSSFIAKLVSRLPAATESDSATDDYLSLLDRVLEDRLVEMSEMTGLLSLANDLGMSGSQARAVHTDYLHDLILAALDDGVITPAEQADLDKVRVLLGFSEEEAAALVERARRAIDEGHGAGRGSGAAHLTVAGKSVCFTGALVCRVGGELATRQALQLLHELGHGSVVECRRGSGGMAYRS
jgi:hypothetical protein